MFILDNITKYETHVNTKNETKEGMKKLKDFLKLNNISYRELAKKLDISPATLSEIINNNRLPTLKLAYDIEKITFKNVTVYDWLDGTISNERTDDKTKENKNKKKA